MFEVSPGSKSDLASKLDGVHARVCRTQLELLRLIADADRLEAWRDSGARDMAHWLGMRYGISHWKARRWIAAAHALETLPRISDALDAGALGIDKVVELARFATPETEERLIPWARAVSCGMVRHRGDLAAKTSIEVVREAEQARSMSWWYLDEGRRFGLEAELPATQGAIVARALERVAETVPAMPGEEDEPNTAARRADALVALCSARIAVDAEPDRATVVVHARLGAPEADLAGCELEGGPVIHPQTVKRLLCNGRVQTVVEDRNGNVLGIGRMSRDPAPWMIRQVRYRDRECRFPGCGARRFTEAHHIVWWRHGGRTDLDNLVLICSFHHRLVHEHGWSVRRESDGTVMWRRPDGARYEAGPSPGIDLRGDEGVADRGELTRSVAG
jgi:uncharacterized protein DUF222/HNH endonuclease